MDLLPAIGLSIGGCCTNAVFLEAIVKQSPRSGDLLTFAQFAFIAAESALYAASHPDEWKQWGRISLWVWPALLYFVVNMLNNYVWRFSVSVPVHTVVRSSGILVSLLIEWASGRRPRFSQLIAVLIICTGSVCGVLLNADAAKRSSTLLGIAFLVIATVLAAFQTFMTSRMGASSREVLFMTHILPLPLFGFFHSAIRSQWSTLQSGARIDLSLYCVTQLLCVRGVTLLIPAGPVTLNVVLAVRKFLTLAISGVRFGFDGPGVPFGGLLVLVGALLYTYEASQSRKSASSSFAKVRSIKSKKLLEKTRPEISAGPRNVVRRRAQTES